MSRIEPLFQELPTPRRTPISRHPKPDSTRPLRMQVIGRSHARHRMLRCRINAWEGALTSVDAWTRTTLITLIVIAVSTAAQLGFWQITLLSAATTAIALISGAWTEVSLERQAEETRNN